MRNRYTLEQIREFIACPELGDDHYGKWGAMTREQRLVMNDLIEMAKEYYASFYASQSERSQKYRKGIYRHKLGDGKNPVRRNEKRSKV